MEGGIDLAALSLVAALSVGAVLKIEIKAPGLEPLGLRDER